MPSDNQPIEEETYSNDAETALENGSSLIKFSEQSNFVIENLHVGVFVLNVEKDCYPIVMANGQFYNLFEDCFSNTKPGDQRILLPGDRLCETTPILRHCDSVRESGMPVHFEWPHGNELEQQHLSCQIKPIKNAEGRVIQMIGTVQDRTPEKRAEKNLLHNALHDPLTGLPNRVKFQESLKSTLRQRANNGLMHCAVLVINVDRFQRINESLGHVAGDEFLITLATRLMGTIRTGDVLARLSGDEFCLLVNDVMTNDEVYAIGRRLHDALAEPFVISSFEFFASVSVGAATTMSSMPYPDELIRDAEFAMHQAKKKGTSLTQVYHRETHQRARSRFLIEIDMRKALQNNDMELHYQPIVCLQSGKLAGFEALSRWTHPVHGEVPPIDFITIAEESGLIVDLGRWSLLEACQNLKSWVKKYDLGKDDIYVSVNVSSAQFTRTDIIEDLAAVLSQSGIDPAYLKLELTETAIMANPSQATYILEQVKSLNVGIAIDDFGTGYSSLAYLQRFPIDILKIDRSFTKDIDINDSNMKIVEMLYALSRTLDMRVIAEGIESHDHVQILKDMGCQMGQGYYFSMARNAKDAEALIMKDHSWSVD